MVHARCLLSCFLACDLRVIPDSHFGPILPGSRRLSKQRYTIIRSDVSVLRKKHPASMGMFQKSKLFCAVGRGGRGVASAGLFRGFCFCEFCFCGACFCGVCSAGVASRALLLRVCSAVFPLRRGKCRMQQAVRQAAERGWRRSDGVQEAFRRRSGGVRVQASAVGSVPARRRFSNSRTAGRPSRGSWQSIRCGRCASLLTRISKKRSPRKGS